MLARFFCVVLLCAIGCRVSPRVIPNAMLTDLGIRREFSERACVSDQLWPVSGEKTAVTRVKHVLG